MSVTEKIEIVVEAKNNVKKGLNDVRDDITGFNNRIKSDTAINLSINVAKIRTELQAVRDRIKESQKSGDFKLEIDLRADEERLKQSLTQASRELRNFARTGEKDVSVLGKLFQGVGQEIEKTREELIKAGKSTKELDIIASKANIIEKEFKEGKISIQQYGKELNKLSNEAKGLTPNLGNLSVKLGDLAKGFLIYKGVGLLKDAFIGALKTSLEFESALAGVNKTLDVTPEQLSKIDDGLKAMTTRIPIAYTELAKIAEVGGQLGVGAEDILKFTETVAMISETTNLTSEEAATDFARISNVIGEPLDNIDKMASSVVDLGNNFAANEKEILNFATNIAGAGKIAGLTAGDIFGISTAFTSVGIEAEAGGTAVQKALLTINTAVATGNDKLSKFAELSGKSREQFVSDWKQDAGKTFSDFVNQLGEAGDKGVLILNDLIGTDVRLQRAFLSLAQNSDLLTEAINTGNTAYEENNALQEEAEKRFATNEAKLQLQKNKWKVFGDYLGDVFLPLFTKLTSFFTEKLPAGFIAVQSGLAILIGIFLQLGTAIAGGFNIALEKVKIFGANISSNLAIFVNGWVGLFQGFVGSAGKLIDNLKEFAGVAFGNIGPLIGKGLNKATKPIQDFFNGFIKNYNNILGKVLGTIDGKVSFGVDFGDTTALPSLTKGVKEEFAKIKGEYDSLSGFILQNAEKQKQAYNSNIENIRSSTFKELQIIEDANNSIALEGLKKIDVLKGNADTALGITQDRIEEEIKAENEAIKKYLEGLDDKNDGAGKSFDKQKDLLKEEEKLEAERLEKHKKYLEEKQKKEDEANKTKIENLKKAVETVGEVLDEEIEQSTKSIEEYQKNIDKLKDSIDGLNEKLKELEQGRAETLGERNIKIDEELAKLRNEEIQDTEAINKLLEEKRLIESNATQSELEEAKRINELSPTARFLEEFEKKKIALEEERELKQQEIADLEEQKLEEEAILQTFTDKKILLDENYAKIRAKIEEDITNKTILEADKQISKLEQLRQKAIQAAEAMRSAGVNVGISEENRPTGNTTNTNITQTYNISNEVDATSVIRDINKNIK